MPMPAEVLLFTASNVMPNLNLKEAITLFDRNVLTIDLNDKGAGLWDKDMTGLKVRDRFDVQAVDKDAVIKGEITEIVNG